MARHGENIHKRKDGRWEGRYPVYSEEKGRKIYRSVYGRSYQEVKGKLTVKKRRNETEKENGAGSCRQTGKTEEREGVPGCGLPMEIRVGYDGRLFAGEGGETESATEFQRQLLSGKAMFTDLAGQWLDAVKETRKPSTYVKYRRIFRQYLEIPFQNTEILLITDQLVRQRLAAFLTDSVRKSIYCVMNQILRFASRQYGITLPVLRRPAEKGSRKPVRSFSRTDQRKLFPVLFCGQDLFKTAVLLCLYTGLRLGEVCALRWEDVDFSGRIITVSRTVQRLYAEGFRTKTVLWESEPKSEHSRREIPISDGVMELLIGILAGENREEDCLTEKKQEKCWPEMDSPEKDWQEMAPREKYREKKHLKNKEYIFGGKKPVEPRTMQNHFKRILKEAGLEERNFHTLRHTFATNCIEGGTDVKSLSELLGHSDVQITLNRYVHPSLDSKRKHLDVLSLYYDQVYDRICGQICGQTGNERQEIRETAG